MKGLGGRFFCCFFDSFINFLRKNGVMALDDQLEPDGRCFIDEIDAKLLGMHKKLADVWQERTYMSKYVLAGLLWSGFLCVFSWCGCWSGNLIAP